MDTRRRIILAAGDLLAEPSPDAPDEGPTLSAIATRSGFSRQTIYRLFPDGAAQVMAALLDDLVESILAGLESRVLTLEDRTCFSEVVGHAVDGAFSALSTHPLGVHGARRGWMFAARFLLDPRSGGLVDRLTRYASRCAAAFGSELANDQIWVACEEFVMQLVRRALREVEGGTLDSSRFSDSSVDLIAGFVSKVQLDDPTRTLSRFAVLPSS